VDRQSPSSPCRSRIPKVASTRGAGSAGDVSLSHRLTCQPGTSNPACALPSGSAHTVADAGQQPTFVMRNAHGPHLPRERGSGQLS
jgi:hypothetical protein